MLLSRAKEVILRGIKYLRHSAEDKQENSVPLQRKQIQEFAAKHGIEIIHEFADEGVSGLTQNRPAFKDMFENWIKNPNAPQFDYILVWDVSRWGRFQDQDEAGSLEFECKKRGKQVIYVSRGFPNKNQKGITQMQTAFDRWMAAEYSQKLSDNVFFSSCDWVKQGYSVGGTAPYGMARQLYDPDRKPLQILKKGDHKVLANAHVKFIPANDETTETVKEIFHLFVEQEATAEAIAEVLNERGKQSPSGGIWTKEKVTRLLMNETYIGTLIYNKTENRLKQHGKSRRRNPPNEWVVCQEAFSPVVNHAIFRKAQERIYFSMPSKWKRGIYIIQRVRGILQQELRKFLLENGVHEDDIFSVLQDFPVLYGVSFYLQPSSPKWCFLIENELRRYTHVLAVGVAMDQHDPIDRVFFVPTRDFGQWDFRIFSEQDSAYTQYCIREDQVEEKIRNIVRELGISIMQPAEARSGQA